MQFPHSREFPQWGEATGSRTSWLGTFDITLLFVAP